MRFVRRIRLLLGGKRASAAVSPRNLQIFSGSGPGERSIPSSKLAADQIPPCSGATLSDELSIPSWTHSADDIQIGDGFSKLEFYSPASNPPTNAVHESPPEWKSLVYHAVEFCGTSSVDLKIIDQSPLRELKILGSRYVRGEPIGEGSYGVFFKGFDFEGKSDIDQLGKVFAAFGTPNPSQWPDMTNLPDYVEYRYVPAPPLCSLFLMASDDTLDLLAKMFTYDPRKRITAQQALEHRYFSSAPAPTQPALLPRPEQNGNLALPVKLTLLACSLPINSRMEMLGINEYDSPSGSILMSVDSGALYGSEPPRPKLNRGMFPYLCLHLIHNNG